MFYSIYFLENSVLHEIVNENENGIKAEKIQNSTYIDRYVDLRE